MSDADFYSYWNSQLRRCSCDACAMKSGPLEPDVQLMMPRLSVDTRMDANFTVDAIVSLSTELAVLGQLHEETQQALAQACATQSFEPVQ
eukprot:5232034-Karenia_brevis.AAC.1